MADVTRREVMGYAVAAGAAAVGGSASLAAANEQPKAADVRTIPLPVFLTVDPGLAVSWPKAVKPFQHSAQPHKTELEVTLIKDKYHFVDPLHEDPKHAPKISLGAEKLIYLFAYASHHGLHITGVYEAMATKQAFMGLKDASFCCVTLCGVTVCGVNACVTCKNQTMCCSSETHKPEPRDPKDKEGGGHAKP